MLAPLRHDVLLEIGTPLADQIAEHMDQLKDLFGQLCALGVVTEQRSMAKGFTLKLPSLPYGQFDFTVGPQDVPAMVTQWRGCRSSVSASPHARQIRCTRTNLGGGESMLPASVTQSTARPVVTLRCPCLVPDKFAVLASSTARLSDMLNRRRAHGGCTNRL
jgi:hypothetical protein